MFVQGVNLFGEPGFLLPKGHGTTGVANSFSGGPPTADGEKQKHILGSTRRVCSGDLYLINHNFVVPGIFFFKGNSWLQEHTPLSVETPQIYKIPRGRCRGGDSPLVFFSQGGGDGLVRSAGRGGALGEWRGSCTGFQPPVRAQKGVFFRIFLECGVYPTVKRYAGGERGPIYH